MAEELAQMGASSVKKIHWQGNWAIQKTDASLLEMIFYRDVAPELQPLGVQTPNLLACDVSTRRLVIEYLPTKVQLTEASLIQALAHLAALHEVKGIMSRPPMYTCTWTLSATEQALDALRLDHHSARIMAELQSQSDYLFEPLHFLSGDSNEGNWGRNMAGQLCQFDWERFTVGHPAIDLAPMIPGMGSRDNYEALADMYLAHRHCSSGTVPSRAELIRHIALAKAWLIVEVVNILKQRKHPAIGKYLDWYRQVLPDWLQHSHKLCNLSVL